MRRGTPSEGDIGRGAGAEASTDRGWTPLLTVDRRH